MILLQTGVLFLMKRNEEKEIEELPVNVLVA
jgi:hypothetical protein